LRESTNSLEKPANFPPKSTNSSSELAGSLNELANSQEEAHNPSTKAFAFLEELGGKLGALRKSMKKPNSLYVASPFRITRREVVGVIHATPIAHLVGAHLERVH